MSSIVHQSDYPGLGETAVALTISSGALPEPELSLSYPYI